jgi:hypothetical protein
MSRHTIVQQFLTERERHFELPGREFDINNTPNDWVAIIASYAAESVRRNSVKPDASDFEDSLIKAAAVIVAALEHMSTMKENAHFSP